MAEIQSLEHGLKETIDQVWDISADLEPYNNKKLDELSPKIYGAIKRFLGDFDKDTQTFSREKTEERDYFALKVIKLENKFRQTRFRIEMQQEELDPVKVEKAFYVLDIVIKRLDSRSDAITDEITKSKGVTDTEIEQLTLLRDNLDEVYHFVRKKEQFEQWKKEGPKLLQQLQERLIQWGWSEAEQEELLQHIHVLRGKKGDELKELEDLWKEAQKNKEPLTIGFMAEIVSYQSELESDVRMLRGYLEHPNSDSLKKEIQMYSDEQTQIILPEDFKKKLKTTTQKNIEQPLPNRRIASYLRGAIEKLQASKQSKILKEALFTGRIIDNPEEMKATLQTEITQLIKAKKNPNDYSILINGARKNKGGQKTYIIDQNGFPIFEFHVSTGANGNGRGEDKTPLGLFQIEKTGMIHQDGQKRASRTRIDRKFGQYFELQTDRSMVPSLQTGGGKARMVSAILALQKTNGGDPGFVYLHGTNREGDLNNRASGGCIRFDNISILVLEELFKDQKENLNIKVIEKSLI